ncbi:translocation/assembly module TamB domain-containing protein [Yoonia sp. 208BN28-4]|uniref:translocation/assembly module TamB domain-containing protein n=1 Tax=Yoonia sp. 208BN28-4 TaxID=3126505 RepID=UPI00309E8E52
MLAPLPAAAQDQAEEDKGYLTRLIEDNLSGAGRDVTIIGFEGALSSEASLDVMTISDDEGVWLTLENVVLDWNRSALLRGAIDVEELSAERVIVARVPVSEADDSAPSPEATPFSLPELPVSVELEKLNIARIELGETILGEPFAASLTGSASLIGGEGGAIVEANRLDDKEGRFIIDASFENETSMLALALELSEGPNGIIARRLDLPGQPPLALTVKGAGPLSSYEAEIALATDGVDRVSGTVTLTEVEGEQRFAANIGGDVTPLLVPEYQEFFGDDVSLIAEGRQLADGRFDLSTFELDGQSIKMTGSALIGAQGWPQRLSLNGTIADTDGDIVLLPLTGPKTYIDRATLAIGYDGSQSDDWSAEFNIAGFDRPGLLIRDITLDGGGILRDGEGASQGEVTANFTYAASGLELDDAGASQALGDEISGVIEIDRIEGEPTNISRLTLTGPGLEMQAAATIAGGGDGFRTFGNIDLQVNALGRFSTLAGRDLAGGGNVNIQAEVLPLDGMFDVTVTGTTNDLAVGIEQLDPLLAGEGEIAVAAVRDTQGTRLEALNIATPEAQITAEADLTSGASNARFDVLVREVGLVMPELSGPVTVTGTAARSAELVTDFDIRAEGPSATITAVGQAIPDTAGQAVNATVQAQIADLETFSELADRDLDGAINAELTGTLLSDGLRFDMDLTAQTTDLAVGVAQVDQLLQGDGTLSVSLAAPRDGVYRAQDLAVDTPAIRLRADATYDASGPADATFDFMLTDAGQVVASLDGPLSLRGTASRDAGGDATVDVTGNGPGTDFAVDAVIEAVTNRITGTLDATVADLSVYRDLAGMPLDGAVTANVAGTALPDLSRFDGTVDLSSTDLAIGNPSVDPLLRGAGTLNATAALTEAGLRVETVNADYPNVTLSGSLEGASGAGEGQFDARLRDIGLIADGISGPATATGTARLDAQGVWAIDAEATAPGASADIDASIAADTYEISGTAEVFVNDLRPYRTISGLPLSGGVTANISGAALPDLTRATADINVTTRDLAIGNATVDPLLRGLGRLDASVSQTTEGLRIRDFSATTPNVSLSGSLDGRAGEGSGQFNARLRDVGLFTDQLSGPVTASGTASRNASGNWGIDVDGTGPGGITVRADGTYNESGTLNMDVDGQVPLGLANAALAPRRLDGTATFDLAVNGPPALSSVSGQVNLNGARLTAPTLDVALTNINGGVSLNGDAAQVDITGQVSSGGTVSVSGPVGLAGGNTADLAVRLNNVGLRDPELYETTVDGQITVRGPLAGGAQIAGTLNLGPTEIQVPSSGVGGLGTLPNVTHVGAPLSVRRTLDRAGVNDDATTSASTGGGGGGYPIDLVINAPSRVFVRGRGLDAELGGQLTLGGTTSNIVPIGQFELIRGRIDILQQRFDLTEGRASLQGDFVPYIRLVASTQSATGTVINIIVEGPATEPEVTFESSPDLPQDEVLAQLIFGRDLADISPLQAVQLAAAVGTLAGRGGGGLIDTFRQDIGLDDFDITTDEEGNAAVRAGAYLSENVYTDVTIASDGSTEVNINLDITDDVTAKGTFSDDGETSIGIFYERDY